MSTMMARNYLNWEEYLVTVIILHRAYRNADNAALIVNEGKQIVSMTNSNVPNENPENHAEFKAVRKIQKGTGITMYSLKFPCEKCAQCIAEAGISKLVYIFEHSKNERAAKVLDDNGIIFSKFSKEINEVIVDIDEQSLTFR